MKPAGPKVVVLGSLNLDHIWMVDRLPLAGETVLATNAVQAFGGKGANQAVAAARQGAVVTLLGAVGSDDAGRRYRDHLAAQGIDPSLVVVSARDATGAAHVYVDSRGDNQIVVNPGANVVLDAPLVRGTFLSHLSRGILMLAQLECPTGGIMEAMRIAHAWGARVVLNASPYRADFQWETPLFAVIVNERESVQFFGETAAVLAGGAPKDRHAFLTRYRIENLIVTRGAAPTLLIGWDSCREIATHQVDAVDTVGAGDTFAGTFAQRIAEGADIVGAVRDANIAAALSTLRLGAQSAMPPLGPMLIRFRPAPAVFLRTELKRRRNRRRGSVDWPTGPASDEEFPLEQGAGP